MNTVINATRLCVSPNELQAHIDFFKANSTPSIFLPRTVELLERTQTRRTHDAVGFLDNFKVDLASPGRYTYDIVLFDITHDEYLENYYTEVVQQELRFGKECWISTVVAIELKSLRLID